MAKENRKQEMSTPQSTDSSSPTQQQAQIRSATPSPAKRSGRARGKGGNQSRIGGTAVPGAKSTLPKKISETNNPQQQQQESYNRDMRRRMERLGMGPQDGEDQMRDLQKRRDKRKRRLERRKERFEDQRAAIRRSSPIGRITLGRKNLYFIIAMAIIVLAIIVFGVLKVMHII